MSFTYPCPRKLREVVKMSLFEREPKDRIVDLWLEYHKSKHNNVAYALSKSEWESFKRK